MKLSRPRVIVPAPRLYGLLSGRWLKYNYITRQVSIYRDAHPRLNDSLVTKLIDVYGKTETCDWRDSSIVRSLMNTIIDSGVKNYFSLGFLSTTYLNYYHLPTEAKLYGDMLIEKYPDVITGYYDKGRALEAENRLEEARVEYMKALDSKIQCEYYQAETDEHLALILESLGERNGASKYATRALDIHRQYWIPDHLNERLQKPEQIKTKR